MWEAANPAGPQRVGMRYLFYSVCIYLRYLINLISTIPIHQNTLPLGADCSGLGGAFSVSCDNAVAESASWQDLSTDKGLCHFCPLLLAIPCLSSECTVWSEYLIPFPCIVLSGVLGASGL